MPRKLLEGWQGQSGTHAFSMRDALAADRTPSKLFRYTFLRIAGLVPTPWGQLFREGKWGTFGGKLIFKNIFKTY